MAKPAVEFVVQGTKLCLIYRPRDDASWVHGRFANGEPLDIKGTFHLTVPLRQDDRMRLSDDQVRHIVNATHELAGHDAQVLLFGSRLHDAVKGGDIDLLVE